LRADTREEGTAATVEEESLDKILKRLLEIDEQEDADAFLAPPGPVKRLFVYDELLSSEVLKRYLDKPHLEMVAQMPWHRLVFPKYFPPRKTGLASVARSLERNAVVWGVTIDVSIQDLSRLDRYKGLPNRYHRRNVYVQDRGGLKFAAFTYAISYPDKQPSKPSAELKQQMLAGARERNLPADYIAFLESIPALD